ncbi:MAG: DUF692 domain-containing protein [Immundisolibacteraceae bacterium]|nr:DUF692 domain-containing protein [Immundisolibacteraceae bacterium]
MSPQLATIGNTGLGLRRVLLDPLLNQIPDVIDFFEVAPENWIGVGGRLGHKFRQVVEQRPLLCHGLSLSLGGPDPIDELLLKRVKRFLDEFEVVAYSEHLSSNCIDGQLYELVPIPFTDEAVRFVAERIRRVQDILERPLIIENISYYAAPGKQIEELDFIRNLLAEADCQLLLDVNNIYVNSVNHGYDAETFLAGVPPDRIAYIHQAGHLRKSADLVVDTHGAAVAEPVWQLLQSAYARFGSIPTLLERDFDIPPLDVLLPELERIGVMQQSVSRPERDRVEG